MMTPPHSSTCPSCRRGGPCGRPLLVIEPFVRDGRHRDDATASRDVALLGADRGVARRVGVPAVSTTWRIRERRAGTRPAPTARLSTVVEGEVRCGSPRSRRLGASEGGGRAQGPPLRLVENEEGRARGRAQASFWPHSGQNFGVPSIFVPHLEQFTAGERLAPQEGQNLPPWVCAPQEGHRGSARGSSRPPRTPTCRTGCTA